ncbi:hypothetical protein IW262DRAFT_1302273 [Armillaria fumosa]|nr:hypothetical protein IW262DRAFT_1302273 [Armillaria fumosa]
MNMNPHLIEDNEMLISRSIYQMVDTVGVAGVIELLHSTTGNAAMSAELNEHPTGTTRGARTLRKLPPSDPVAFDAWIVALFLQNIDTMYQYPQRLYVRQRAPHHIPPTDPAAFDAWITLFFTHNTLLRGPSGWASMMAHPSYLENELPWWIVPPGLPPLL